MTDELKKIMNKNIEILENTDKTITYLRIQNFYRALNYYSRVIDLIMEQLADFSAQRNYFQENMIDINQFNLILNDLLDAQEQKDYILLADLLELRLIPYILQIQGCILSHEDEIHADQAVLENNLAVISRKDPDLGILLKKSGVPSYYCDNKYSVEYTSCGLLTLALFRNNKKYYLHSNSLVFHEAHMLAVDWFHDDQSEYTIYGLGFGYHIKELMELDDSITIRIYESDINIIRLACTFIDLKMILETDRVQLIYDPDFIKLSNYLSLNKSSYDYLIHYPSLRNIQNNVMKEQMDEYFIHMSSVKNQLHKLNNNFKSNVKYYDDYVDSLKSDFYGKNLFIIAAGPSLDRNFQKLNEVKENSIILATGTIYKKLLKAGIHPDYVIITDANSNVFKQIEDVEQSDIPLIILSTVYYKIPMLYKGNKYLVCQEGFDKAEKFAINNNYTLFQTGGSVSTTALDIGIRLGCRRIIYLGLDLAYTNNLDHASDTASLVTMTSEELKQVEDINGNMVRTSNNLNIYRKWIENRIKDIKNIEFIDATEGGAKIAGFQIMELQKCLSHINQYH